MVKTFVVSKKSVDLELLVDGTIDVKPMPHNSFSEETIKILAASHDVSLKWYTITHSKEEFVDLAVSYFKKHGYDVKEK